MKYSDLFANPNQFLLSPSGNYKADIEDFDDDGVKSYRLYIIDIRNDGTLKYEVDFIFRARDKNFIFWADEADVLWVYSGDTGTYFWINNNDIWIKKSYADNQEAKVPQALKDVRPNIFK